MVYQKKDSAAIIDDILDEIKARLVKDGIVKISSFGTFLVKKKGKARKYTKYTKKVVVQARNSVSFRPLKVIKINQ
ncbi:MAG: HU family DNA-binding protein [Wolbachia sp.]